MKESSKKIDYEELREEFISFGKYTKNYYSPRNVEDSYDKWVQLKIQKVCTFCEKEVLEEDSCFTEDAEIAHNKCLESFNKHWDDRDEYLDLLN